MDATLFWTVRLWFDREAPPRQPRPLPIYSTRTGNGTEAIGRDGRTDA